MKFLIPFAVAIVWAFFGGWLFMITVGVIHAEWLTMMPTVGYGSSLLIFALIATLFTAVSWRYED